LPLAKLAKFAKKTKDPLFLAEALRARKTEHLNFFALLGALRELCEINPDFFLSPFSASSAPLRENY